MPSSSAKQSTHRVGMVSKIEVVMVSAALGESHAFGRAAGSWAFATLYSRSRDLRTLVQVHRLCWDILERYAHASLLDWALDMRG